MALQKHVWKAAMHLHLPHLADCQATSGCFWLYLEAPVMIVVNGVDIFILSFCLLLGHMGALVDGPHCDRRHD